VKRLEAPWALGIGIAVVLVTNAVMLGGAARNRSGEPSATLELTERELAMPLHRDKDDTGLALSLVLTDAPPPEVALAYRLRDKEIPEIEHAWLDAAKLRELGFDTEAALRRVPKETHGHGDIPGLLARPAYVVCEYDGEAWRVWLAGRERWVQELRDRVARGSDEKALLADAEALLAIDRASRSRLMPIDAGADPERLRERYLDRRRFAIIPASIVLEAVDGAIGSPTLRGDIHGLEVSGIHVPLALLARLEPFAPRVDREGMFRRAREEAARGWPAAAAPRYRATVRIGRGYRAWLTDVQAVAGSEAR
jgi:hypothetical protein